MRDEGETHACSPFAYSLQLGTVGKFPKIAMLSCSSWPVVGNRAWDDQKCRTSEVI